MVMHRQLRAYSGRETRDMGRKDYNALKRSTRVIVYKDSWLERQENIKVMEQKGVQTPLAKSSVRIGMCACLKRIANR